MCFVITCRLYTFYGSLGNLVKKYTQKDLHIRSTISLNVFYCNNLHVHVCNGVGPQVGPPGVLGIWGEWLFIFRELGSTVYYFWGALEQGHNLGDLGSLAKKQKNKEKPPFCLIFLNFLLPQTPL